jgi:hypothetical protein
MYYDFEKWDLMVLHVVTWGGGGRYEKVVYGMPSVLMDGCALH